MGGGMHHGSRGYEVAASRGKTAQKALTIDWDYPVYSPETRKSGNRTESPLMPKALDLSAAYKVLAKEDQRPLLVLREFSTFDDPDNEKLSRKLYTEKTVLLTHWFNCVRLPHHVMEADHPFHNLFTDEEPPQLFLASADGSNVVPFDYTRSRADLEKVMIGILDDYYVENPSKVLNDVVQILKRFDKLDRKIQDLKESLDKAIERSGPKTGKARKLMQELERAEQEYKALKEEQKTVRDIPLKNTENK